MKKPLFVLLLVLIVSAFVLTACGGSGEEKSETIPAPYAGMTNPYAGDSAAIAAGKVTFEAKCASCHGTSGKGDGPAGQALTPPAADLTNIPQGDDFIYYRIAEGGAMDPYNSAMPAHKDVMSEDEIWQVVSYIRTLK